MNNVITRKEIAASIVLAAATLCIGVYCLASAGDPGGTAFLRFFSIVSFLIVLRCTFALGRLRGFAVRSETGEIHFGNLVRNLVAAIVIFFCVVWLAAPLLPALVKAAQ